MEETLRKVGLLLDAQRSGDNIDFSGPKDLGPPLIREIKREMPSTNDGGSQEAKIAQDREEEILHFLMWLEKLHELNPDSFNAIIADGCLHMGETDHEDIKKELSLLSSYLKERTNNSIMDSHGTIEKHINIPGNAEKPPPVPGIKVTPTPGFCLKTTCINDGSKVFVNICSHDEINEPSIKKRLNDIGEEVEGINVPMSVGPPHPCEDKSGVICVAYDVIVSPKVLESSKDDQTGQYKDFVCRLGIQSIQQKLKDKKIFDQRYKLPKGLTYMGHEIHSQMIQDRKNMPSIEEVKFDATCSVSKGGNKSTNNMKSEHELNVTLLWGKGNTSNCLSIVDSSSAFADYFEPLLIAPSDVTSIVIIARLEDELNQKIDLENFDVQVSVFKAMIKIPSYRLKTIFFPCAVDVGTVSCELREVKGPSRMYEFIFHGEIEKEDWAVDADPGSKNWLMRTAIRDDLSDFNKFYPTKEFSSDEYPEKMLIGDDKIYDKELSADRFELSIQEVVKKDSGLPDSFHDSIINGSLQTQKPKEYDRTEFAEDEFHRRDANSQYIISQREQAVKDKWVKHEKEKQDRVDDPSVEYIDVDDFKPGGKHAPCLNRQFSRIGSNYADNTLKDAKQMLLKVSTRTQESTTGENGRTSEMFESELWSELLD